MKSHLALAISCLCASISAHAVGVSGQGTWESTLQARDLDGNLTTAEAYYDTVLGITWLADANNAGTTMTWATANVWANGLNPYGSGIIGWRLPKLSTIDGTTADDANLSYIGNEDRGFNISAPGTLYAGSTTNEMANLYYNTLGNKGYCDPSTSTVSSCDGPQTGWGLTNTGPFSNAMSDYYWLSTEYALNSDIAWVFVTGYGEQGSSLKADYRYAWAVHDGSVGVAIPTSAVPLPASIWLLGSGLLGLIRLTKRRDPS